jgi:RNA polymerase sigma-70 factor, ECF subfamily
MMITTEGIWQELHTSLRAFIARRVPPEDVDDLLQDVFVRIHRGLATLAQRERVQAWVYQITRNTIVDYYRTRGGPVGQGSEAALAELMAETPDDDEAHTAAVRGELATCLEPLLRQLPNTYRDAVLLADFRGETQRAVAERLGLSVSGVKSRVQRGRARLRTLLQACCELEIDHRGSVVDCQSRGATCYPAGDVREPPAPLS